MAGYQLTSSQMKAIRETVRTVMNQFRGSMPSPGQMQVQRCLTVKLDGAMSSASNAATTPATATASVLRRQASGDYIDTETDITVVNRYEHITLGANTLAVAMWMDGEWRLISADCSTLAATTITSLTPVPEEEPP
jgi:hypothetical protein